MSPRGRVRAILVALAHLYVVLTFPPLSERSSYFLPFPDHALDLRGSRRRDFRHARSRK